MTNQTQANKEMVVRNLMDTFTYEAQSEYNEIECYLDDEASEHVTEDERKQVRKYLDEGNIGSAIELLNLEITCYDPQFYFDYEKEYTVEILDRIVKWYEKRYNTVAHSLVFIGQRSSHYGRIGGNGAEGGYYCDAQDTEKLFDHLNGDDVRIYIENGIVNVGEYDHDGTNYTEMYILTESEWEVLDAREEGYQDSYDVVNFVNNKGKNPVKVPNKLMKSI